MNEIIMVCHSLKMIRKKSAMSYAHMLLYSNDNAVTVFLQQYEAYYKILSKKGHTPTI